MKTFMVRSIIRHQRTEQIGVRQGQTKRRPVRSKRENVRHCDTAEKSQLQKEVEERAKARGTEGVVGRGGESS